MLLLMFLIHETSQSLSFSNAKLLTEMESLAVHTVLMDPIEHFMLGNSPFMRYPYTQYMRPSGTVLGTPE